MSKGPMFLSKSVNLLSLHLLVSVQHIINHNNRFRPGNLAVWFKTSVFISSDYLVSADFFNEIRRPMSFVSVKLDFTAFFSSKPRHLNITVASSALLMVSFGLKVESSYPLKIPASVTAFIYLAAQWFYPHLWTLFLLYCPERKVHNICQYGCYFCSCYVIVRFEWIIRISIYIGFMNYVSMLPSWPCLHGW